MIIAENECIVSPSTYARVKTYEGVQLYIFVYYTRARYYKNIHFFPRRHVFAFISKTTIVVAFHQLPGELYNMPCYHEEKFSRTI